MIRNKALGMTIIALLLTSLACNAFSGSLEPFPPPPTAIIDETAKSESVTPAATVTLSSLRPLSSARVTILVDLNVRSGPGVQYDRVGFILKDETASVLGVHGPTGWWQIECPDIANGSECWVSGGEQYTRAEKVEGVAEVAAPSTPTPVPPTLAEGLGLLAYIEDGTLSAASLDLTKNPPQLAEESMPLADIVNVQRLSISPDGRRVAFIASTLTNNRLYVVNADGQDLRNLLDSNELPLEIDQTAVDFVLLLNQINWLPDSTTLAFNTIAVDPSGPGVTNQEDLWLVTLDGELSQILPTGEGGGIFAFMANDRLLLSRSDSIVRADLDGSNNEVILQFEPVNTASEYAFYPSLQQAGKGETVTHIPDPQPWEPEAWTTLWQIPGIGQAGQLGAIEGIGPFEPVIWSPDGSRLAYVLQPDSQDPESVSRVVVADGTGINAAPYAGGNSLVVHSWAPDGARFIYSGEGFYALGRENAPPVQTILSPGQRVRDGQWISNEAFIAAAGFPDTGVWELLSSNGSGESASLLSFHGFEPIFDVWTP